MKVLHINSYYSGNRIHVELTEALQRHCCSQLVYVPAQQEPSFESCSRSSEGIRIICSACFNKYARILWPFKIVQILWDIRKVIGEERFDVIHAHSLFSNGLVGCFIAKRYGGRFIVSIRNTDVNTFLRRSRVFRRLGARILRRAFGVLVLSPAYFKKLCDPKLVPYHARSELMAKTRIVPSGVNSFWEKHRSRKSRSHRGTFGVVFVGTIDANKNLGTLLDACSRFENLEVHVVGDGPLLAHFRTRAGPNVRFHGRIMDRENLMRIYRKADLFVLPSIHETFGLVYVEAMSQGLPIIYTRQEGVDGFFPEGSVGYSINPMDAEELARKITDVIENWSVLSENAFRAAALFTWRKSALEVADLYQSGAGAGKGRFAGGSQSDTVRDECGEELFGTREP